MGVPKLFKITCLDAGSPCKVRLLYQDRRGGELFLYASLSEKEPSIECYDVKA
jgi:hypothetical protein